MIESLLLNVVACRLLEGNELLEMNHLEPKNLIPMLKIGLNAWANWPFVKLRRRTWVHCINRIDFVVMNLSISNCILDLKIVSFQNPLFN